MFKAAQISTYPRQNGLNVFGFGSFAAALCRMALREVRSEIRRRKTPHA